MIFSWDSNSPSGFNANDCSQRYVSSGLLSFLITHVFRHLLSYFYLFVGNFRQSKEILSYSCSREEKLSAVHSLLSLSIASWISFFKSDFLHCQQLLALHRNNGHSRSLTSIQSFLLFFESLIYFCEVRITDTEESNSIGKCRQNIQNILFYGRKLLEKSSVYSSALLSLFFVAYSLLFLLSQKSMLDQISHRGGGLIHRMQDLILVIIYRFQTLTVNFPP